MGKVMAIVGLVLFGFDTVGNCAWEYRENDENTAHQISDLEIVIPDGPIVWKVTRTIRLKDADGKIHGEWVPGGVRPYTLEKARQFGFDQPFLEACLG